MDARVARELGEPVRLQLIRSFDDLVPNPPPVANDDPPAPRALPPDEDPMVLAIAAWNATAGLRQVYELGRIRRRRLRNILDVYGLDAWRHVVGALPEQEPRRRIFDWVICETNFGVVLQGEASAREAS
jgi:hypothetical protein